MTDTLIGYDSVTPWVIPATAAWVLPYMDGEFAWSQSDLDRFPRAIKKFCTVGGLLQADVYDIEYKDGTPQSGAAWSYNKIKANLGRPTLYTEISEKPDCIAELANYGLTFSNAGVGGEVDWFATFPNGVPSLWPGSVATQYAWYPNQNPLNYDTNIALASWLGVVPRPPLIVTGDGMFGELAASKQDNFNATVRYLWGTVRSDGITNDWFEALWNAYNGEWGGSFDLVLAAIIDQAGVHLRANWGGAV